MSDENRAIEAAHRGEAEQDQAALAFGAVLRGRILGALPEPGDRAALLLAVTAVAGWLIACIATLPLHD